MQNLGKRRNALGFTVRTSSRRHIAEASIVWGRRADGSRLFITEAERGSRQGLRCECGAALVAKQGEVKAWHFAHEADPLATCSIAAARALAEFASQAVRKRGVILPGPDAFEWRPNAIQAQPIPGGVLLRTERAPARLDIFIFRRKRNDSRYIAAQKACDVSALAIVLGGVEYHDDAAIEAGLHATCARRWIFNRKASTSPLPDGEDLAARLERMFPAEAERDRLRRKAWRG